MPKGFQRLSNKKARIRDKWIYRNDRPVILDGAVTVAALRRRRISASDGFAGILDKLRKRARAARIEAQ
jgi:hypothetical protein